MSKFSTLILLLVALHIYAAEPNYALEFNGHDAQVDISMKPLLKEWTISAWIHKEGAWADDEVIVGNGWVTVQEWEDYPLHVHKGKLCCYRSGLFAPEEMPQGWHQIASSWDGKKARLFIDGKQVAEKEGGRPTCPSFVGSDDGKEYFKGRIDELRIWNKALSVDQLCQWMNKPVTSAHPDYASLVAYYRFDDRALDATDYKGIHKGDIKQHYKSASDGGGPMYVANSNRSFKIPEIKMKLLQAQQLQTSFPLRAGQKKVEILKLKINCEGSQQPLTVDHLQLDLSGCSDLADVERVRLFALGANAELASGKELIAGGLKPQRKMGIACGQQLQPGINYIAVCFDLKPSAKAGNAIDAFCYGLELNGETIAASLREKPAPHRVLPKARNVNELKVLNWNIWHGGIEKGRDIGPVQVADIIRACDADVVAMVETYGSGKRIADLLGFHFYEPYKGSNLSILSRHPILQTYKSAKGDFYSTGAKVELPNGREALIWVIWIRYWGPDYVLQQYSKAYSAHDWIKGDEEAADADLKEILEKDIAKHHDGKMPLIFAGDFNSCSHVDMTSRAAKAGLHNGWVVDLPVHKQMFAQDFKDSYRESNPNESIHHGGTWAANYRWSDDFRIDFIYYKGRDIQARSSHVISEHPQADVLWPGDHSAVFSVFDVGKE